MNCWWFHARWSSPPRASISRFTDRISFSSEMRSSRRVCWFQMRSGKVWSFVKTWKNIRKFSGCECCDIEAALSAAMAILDRNLAVFVPAAPVAASMLLVVDCIVDSPDCVFVLRLPGVLASIPSRSSSSSCTSSALDRIGILR